jgi:hypothetical protein
LINTSVWQQFSCSFTLSAASTIHVALLASNAPATAGGWVVWDNISLVDPPTILEPPQCGTLATLSIDQQAACYGISFTQEGGDSTVVWNAARKQSVLDGIRQITTALPRLGLQNYPNSFRSVFGSQPIVFHLQGDGGTASCNPSFMSSTRTITFPVGGKIDSSNVFCVNQYTVVHELGHMLRRRIVLGGGLDPAGSPGYLLNNLIHYSYQGTDILITKIDGIWTRGQYGWNCNWRTYQQHPERGAPGQNYEILIPDQATRLDEAFADLFLNWVYDSFQNQICSGQPTPNVPDPNFNPGTRRREYVQGMLLTLVPSAQQAP